MSGLAEQYEQEQMRLSEQVKSLSEHVRGFTSELREELTQYQMWANSLEEQQHLFDAHVNALTDAYNNLVNLLDEQAQ